MFDNYWNRRWLLKSFIWIQMTNNDVEVMKLNSYYKWIVSEQRINDETFICRIKCSNEFIDFIIIMDVDVNV